MTWQVTPKHLYTHDPTKSEWADNAVWRSVGTYPEMSSHATCQGTFIDLQSPQIAELLWTDSGIKSGFSVRELISTLKKKMQVGNQWSNILTKSLQTRKKAP